MTGDLTPVSTNKVTGEGCHLSALTRWQGKVVTCQYWQGDRGGVSPVSTDKVTGEVCHLSALTRWQGRCVTCQHSQSDRGGVSPVSTHEVTGEVSPVSTDKVTGEVCHLSALTRWKGRCHLSVLTRWQGRCVTCQHSQGDRGGVSPVSIHKVTTPHGCKQELVKTARVDHLSCPDRTTLNTIRGWGRQLQLITWAVLTVQHPVQPGAGEDS